MRDILLEAQARELDIPAADLERIAPVLAALEQRFRPLVAAIPLETEPAVKFEARGDQR